MLNNKDGGLAHRRLCADCPVLYAPLESELREVPSSNLGTPTGVIKASLWASRDVLSRLRIRGLETAGFEGLYGLPKHEIISCYAEFVNENTFRLSISPRGLTDINLTAQHPPDGFSSVVVEQRKGSSEQKGDPP
jgi:hypothetical protein